MSLDTTFEEIESMDSSQIFEQSDSGSRLSEE